MVFVENAFRSLRAMCPGLARGPSFSPTSLDVRKRCSLCQSHWMCRCLARRSGPRMKSRWGWPARRSRTWRGLRVFSPIFARGNCRYDSIAGICVQVAALGCHGVDGRRGCIDTKRGFWEWPGRWVPGRLWRNAKSRCWVAWFQGRYAKVGM